MSYLRRRSTNTLRRALLFVVVTVAITNAQSNATYFGVWKSEPAKSDLGAIRISIIENQGEFTLTDLLTKRSYRFRIDGKPYADPYGLNVVWTTKAPRTWHTTYSKDGNQVAEETYTLSSDGKTLTTRSSVVGMSGEQGVQLTRKDAGANLAGDWTGKNQAPSFDMHIEPAGPNGLLYRVPGVLEVKAIFDSKPYPMTGSLTEKGATAAFTRTGPRSFRTLQKTGDKTTLDATATASEDGKTLTLSGVNEAGKVTWVFTRVK